MSNSPHDHGPIHSVPRLFGTDGVRGTAGEHPLDHDTIQRLGAALVRALPHRGARTQILIGRDTRESGEWIERDLAHGAAGEGATVTSVDIVPTPAVAYLTGSADYDLGVVISASHNPFADNGIKVFSGSGEKFTERVERQIEAIVADRRWQVRDTHDLEIAREDLVRKYLDHLCAVLPLRESDRRPSLVIDCANGATTAVAPTLFRRLGFEPVVIGASPNGRNINLGCGSTHPETLSETVVRMGADLGVAFDGDGDRAIFVDEHGHVVNGDAVLLMCARQLRAEGRLRGDAIVATVMSNIGLEIALRELGIGMVRCAVGDKYVMEEMQARGLSLGGEQSGHIIFSDYLFTGDGLCTALNVLRTMMATGRTLGQLSGDLVSFPQVLLNVRVREKVDVMTVPAIAAAIHMVEASVADQGRVLIRYSGTEPLLRVMLEGRDQDEIRGWAQGIIDVAKRELG